MSRVLLTITTTREPATDLGYLLHKHPGRAQRFELPVGVAHVVYPEADERRCTCALLLEVDPVALVRGRRGDIGFALGQYVNDRPYAASSLLAVALGRVFRTAMTGRCEARPELAATAIPLQLHVPALPCRGGADLATRLFTPLGWAVTATPVPLDPELPDWGPSPYVDLHLAATMRLADALHQLYVLLPVLDDAKHYWVSPDEVDKLVRAGAGWLAAHPERELITRRYLAHQRSLAGPALERLAELDGTEPDAEPEIRQRPLVRLRHEAVLAALRDVGARRIGDLGCGEGTLALTLLAEPGTEVVATDVSTRALRALGRRLERLPDQRRARITAHQSSLVYRDEQLAGLDAAVLMEVVEHVDPPRLPALERAVFGEAKPGAVVVTTPNAEHNVRFEGLPAGTFRHPDHRFEWTRAEFRIWADGVAQRRGYTVELRPVGPDDPEVGPPTQLALFRRLRHL